MAGNQLQTGRSRIRRPPASLADDQTVVPLSLNFRSWPTASHVTRFASIALRAEQRLSMLSVRRFDFQLAGRVTNTS